MEDSYESMTIVDLNSSFTVDLPIDQVIPVQEISLENEPLIEENLTDNQPVTFEIVPGGTKRGKPRLHGSDGYMYTIRNDNSCIDKSTSCVCYNLHYLYINLLKCP